MKQRRFNAAQALQQKIAQGSAKDPNQKQNIGIPPELERQYHISFTPGPKQHFVKLREIKANSIGSMVAVKGIVTKISDVKPCMQVAVYACDACGFEIYQVVTGKQFTPMIECPGAICMKNNVKGQLVIQVKQSKFVSYQEIKL